ncbi:regulator of chromosome condensation [Geosmithia morbida]|uniref:Regulator of chromosome condensation n=1 Tax=Geosmithia morbida TaxID=1094350 RepID=A0A9P5D574_9HYPO|nr:regulator of chromosome condensation [Geosmithia morbida]KAF4122209.1 regulator of chromosome condensation [Geosmithia morbida]
MAPRAKATAPKPKATAATTKKPGASTATKKTKAAAAPAKKTATNGASKKRKASDDDDDDLANKDVPEVKKAKRSAKSATPAVKDDDHDDEKNKEDAEPEAKNKKKKQPATAAASKRAKSATPAPAPAPVKRTKSATPAPRDPRPQVAIGRKINDAPTQVLDIYVFGEGTSGELGLGSKRVNGKKPIDVKRPRLNDNLKNVVQLSCGGMHVVALTSDNQILTWGVNDQGALGRDTSWDGGLRDMDKPDGSDSEDDDDDTGINPRESTPTAVSDVHFAANTRFVQVVASDSASFALTEDGRVYGWGTFRSSDGILGFTDKIRVQYTPLILPTLKGITSLTAGANHILALDAKGNVSAWGCGQQNQLARRIIERNKLSSLTPQGVGLPRGKIAKVACGSYHSFAVDKSGTVWGWGLNNFGEVGIGSNAGEDDAVILRPAKITALDGHAIQDIDGGGHHSLACNDKGELLTWGRVDGYQVGIDKAMLTKDNAIFDDRNDPRILVVPTVVPDVSNVTRVAAGTDNSFAVTGDGKVYSWGFSSNYQTGQGVMDDIEKPTIVDNTAIRGKKIVLAGAGGQFSVVMGIHEDETNGTNET